MRTLIAWLGNTDLRASDGDVTAADGPILSGLKGKPFDRVVLLSNYPEKASAKFAQWLQHHSSVRIQIENVKLRGPTDFEDIYRAASNVQAALSAKLPQASLTYHLSPGTPAMAAVWILLSKTRYPAELIESSREQGVRTVSFPFDLAAEFLRSAFLDLFGDPVTKPKGWPIVPISQMADVRDGTHDTPDYVSSGIPFVTSTHLRGDHINFSTAKLISEADHLDFSRRSAVDDGDILFGMIGTVGNATLVRKDREFSIKNVALFKPNREIVTSSFLWMLLRDHRFLTRMISSEGKGGTQKFVALGPLRSQLAPRPERAQLRAFEEILARYRDLRAKVVDSLSEAETLFHSLQQRAFNGELAAT